MEGSGNSWEMRNHLEEFNLDSLGLLGGTSPEKQIEGSNILSLMQDEVGHSSMSSMLSMVISFSGIELAQRRKHVCPDGKYVKSYHNTTRRFFAGCENNDAFLRGSA